MKNNNLENKDTTKKNNFFVQLALEYKAFGLWFAQMCVLFIQGAKKTYAKYTNFKNFGPSVKLKWFHFKRFWKENYNPLVFISRLAEFWTDFSNWAKTHKFATFMIFLSLGAIITCSFGAAGYAPYVGPQNRGKTFWEASYVSFYTCLTIFGIAFLSSAFGLENIISSWQKVTRKYPRAMGLTMSIISLIIVVICGLTGKSGNFFNDCWLAALIVFLVLIYVYSELYIGLLTRLLFKKSDDGRNRVGENVKGYLYLAPALVPLLVFTFYPMINAVLMGFVKFGDGFSYSNWSFIDFWVRLFTNKDGFIQKNLTLDWFITTFNDPGFSHSLITTIIVMLVTVPVSTGISVVIAVIMNSIKKFQALYQTVYFLPYVTAMTAVTAVWRLILADNGILNNLFNAHVPWLTATDPLFTIGSSEFMGFQGGVTKIQYDPWAYQVFPQMFAFMIYSTWSGLAFKIVIFLTGLQGIDKQVYQAAQLDQASKTRVFFKITLPLLAPIMLYITTTSMIGAFKTYTSIKSLFLNNPKFETIVFYMFRFIDTSKAYDRGSAVADLLFIIIMSFTAVRLFVKNRRKDNGPEKGPKQKKMKRADRILAKGGHM